VCRTVRGTGNRQGTQARPRSIIANGLAALSVRVGVG
jgi:hypothetical protein